MDKTTYDCLTILMREAKEFHLMKSNFGKTLTLSCKIRNDMGDSIEITKSSERLDEIVEEAYLAYSRYTSALPEFRPAIEHRPAKPEFEPPAVDDEIPF